MHNLPSAKKQIIYHFNRAAKFYQNNAVLQRIIGYQLLDLQNNDEFKSQSVVDLGGGDGYFLPYLQRQFMPKQLQLLDIAINMLDYASLKFNDIAAFICADFDNLPLSSASVDLIYANMALQWSTDLTQTLVEIRRALTVHGALLCTIPVAGTLFELQQSAQVASHTFLTERQLQRVFQRAGFTQVNLSVYRHNRYYHEVTELLGELKALGVRQSMDVKNYQWRGKHFLNHLLSRYEKCRNAAGWLPATYRIAYITASF